MTKDYIPKGDAEFNVWLKNFVGKVETNKGKLPLAAGSGAALQQQQAALEQVLTEEEAARVAYEAKREERRTLRREAEAEARAAVRVIQADKNVTDALRAELQIPLRDAPAAPVPPITSRPVITIDFSQRLRHTLEYRDSETPTSRARPAGATGCEFHAYVGTTPPTGTGQFKYLDTDASSPYTVNYTDADAGKTAYYIARWVNPGRNEKGPWSETVSAVITG
ncbi:MAG TPA: hypothetical protein VF546_00045 [Pyrinomonadaceae bacterium]|jgi:hypothetical protein